MLKKYRKFICIGILFLLLLSAGFFNLFTNKVFAAGTGLEVEYPTVSGQNITINTKLPDYIKYLFNLGMFLGFFSVFISLTIAGVMYLLSSVSAELKANAKDRISGAISGLLILALTYLIITTINPQLRFLTSNQLPPAPQPPATKKAPGVYFYTNSSDCPGKDPQLLSTSNLPDLAAYRNVINSVNIIHNPDNKTYYLSILYDSVNFRGKCYFLNSTDKNCQPAIDPQTGGPFAASASIYKYNDDPNYDGVYFYRKSYFNDKGGYYKIGNSDIKNTGGKAFVKKLDTLKFTGSSGGSCNVPEIEQDCVKYDEKQKCVQRSCPTLAGENISSVKINGHYLVLFIYFGPKDTSNGPWTYCQEFPTVDDTNRWGPEQMKWQNIRNNNSGVDPNYVMIVPINN